ncbi:hypothetical protein CL628_01615 [bacterium]|nr:hypothetical protein [bacterium]
MKFGLVGTIVIIVVILVIAWVVVGDNSEEETAPLTTPDPNQQLTDTTSGGNGGQFIQLAPTDVPQDSDEVAATEEEATTETAPATGNTVDVAVDETGFTPGIITIAVGDTVKFTNDGQGKHWPASDVHPTHTVLPGFDSKRGLETGEEYSHTFTKVGTWKCHDHLAASNGCTIVVE